MAEKFGEWPGAGRRKHHSLRESVEHLLRDVRETHGDIKAISNPEVWTMHSLRYLLSPLMFGGAVVAIGAFGCGRAEGPDSYSIVDSAGVEIVTNVGPT